MSKGFVGIVLGVTVLVGGVEGCEISIQTDTSNDSTVTPTSSPANSDSLIALEESIYQQVNQYRQSRNLPPLKSDDRITEQARIHSQRMAQGIVPFSHEGFEGRIQAIAYKISYQRAAENVAYNQGYRDPATQAVRGWINSPSHRQNMEGEFNLAGIGVAKNAAGEYYFTQIFILER